MISWIKWIIGLLLFAFVVGFLHYTLPQRDIVRIVDANNQRIDFSWYNRGFFAQSDLGNTDVGVNRDIRFIFAIQRDGDPYVYRNEDTGWIWPPYFKFDSNNLQAEALDGVSTKEEPKWYIVRHYGWRIKFWSIYPNAISVTPTDTPDKRLIPWFNIIILLILFAIFWAIFVRIRRFWNRRVEPVLDQVDANVDETREKVGGFFKRIE